jgi:hypothetical protein
VIVWREPAPTVAAQLEEKDFATDTFLLRLAVMSAEGQHEDGLDCLTSTLDDLLRAVGERAVAHEAPRDGGAVVPLSEVGDERLERVEHVGSGGQHERVQSAEVMAVNSSS